MAKTTTRGFHKGGRPPKFREPSGPVTVTLPNRTLDQLRSIDEDRARAIVKAVDEVVGGKAKQSNGAEVVEMAPGIGVLLVPSSSSLRALKWVRMIEVAPGRYLLAIVPGTPIERIEVSLMDLIEEARDAAPHDLPVLETLAEKIRDLRRGKRISLAEILFVAI